LASPQPLPAASGGAFRAERALPPGLRFLDPATMVSLFEMPADLQPVATTPNRLNDQALVRYYEQEWGDF
jgi:spermidine synthase